MSEETNPEQEPDPGPLWFAVKVEVYGLSRYAVLHRDWCYCVRNHTSTMRSWRNYRVQGIHELLRELWPTTPVEDWEPRRLVRRLAVAACQPVLPIPPEYRTLMREENTLTEMLVMACPDATGKYAVHDPHCQHAARLRAAKQRTGRTAMVSSVRALAAVVFPEQTEGGTEEQLAAIAESEFEVKTCCVLPLNEPVPVSWETKLAVARKRAHAALLAMSMSARGDDRRATDSLYELLGKRRDCLDDERARPMALPDDVRAYVASAEAASLWSLVSARAYSSADSSASLDERALAWVTAAQAEMGNVAKSLTRDESEGGTLMGVAFDRARRTGRHRFLRDCKDALHEVNTVERQVRG